MNQYIETFKKLGDYSGRASRREFWTFVLGNLLLSLIIGFIAGAIAVAMKLDIRSEVERFSNIFNFILFFPSITVYIRRMHDTNRSGWFSIIPFYNLYLSFIKGDNVPNRFGEVPNK